MRILISDFADLLMSPLLWIFVLLILAVLTKSVRRRKRYLITILGALLFFTNSFIADRFLHWWEYDPVRLDGHYSICIVLSGNILDYDATTDTDIFRANADRFMQSVSLVEEGRVDSLIFAGRSGDRGMSEFNEAIRLSYWADMLDIPCSADTVSTNTWESAREYSKGEQTGGPVLLLTSASHMRRAIASFRQAGIEVDPFPVARITGRPNAWDLVSFETSSLMKWKVLFHEWGGMIYYRISGKS